MGDGTQLRIGTFIREWWEVQWRHTLQPITERFETRDKARSRYLGARDVYHDSDVRLVHVTRWKVVRRG